MVATEFQCSCMQLDRDFNLFLKMFHQTKYSLSVTSVTVNQSVLLKKTETSVSTLKRGIKLVITRLFFVIIYEILFAIMNYHCIEFFQGYYCIEDGDSKFITITFINFIIIILFLKLNINRQSTLIAFFIT